MESSFIEMTVTYCLSDDCVDLAFAKAVQPPAFYNFYKFNLRKGRE
ncbi:hypothetical protein DDD_2445 [Nonlabens dokdonensis DSW-6]|uniref:Uncharacterized protein n=1 Tax=Nonlabens dokdonensis (strain DSM 17205 / KCTC 12402 / DSW-6) TaxID=592029 RepID=L7WF99_NONDD|nr:hypothetical protein DDD_2445 [Nonlabens dokdonensis DSW-6]